MYIFHQIWKNKNHSEVPFLFFITIHEMKQNKKWLNSFKGHASVILTAYKISFLSAFRIVVHNCKKKKLNLVLICCGVPIAIKEPWSMIPIRLQSASHSVMLCEVRSIARRFSRTALSKHQIWRLAFGSIPAVGSSSNIKSVCDINATAKLKRRRCPPLKKKSHLSNIKYDEIID